MRLANKIGEKKDAYNIGDDIRSLERRILDITRKRETYGIGRFKELGGDMATSSREELVVGFEDDFKLLLAKLLDYEGDGGQAIYYLDIWHGRSREDCSC
ncbi:hypothetical protein YC2023_010686 [Brassica napus]